MARTTTATKKKKADAESQVAFDTGRIIGRAEAPELAAREIVGGDDQLLLDLEALQQLIHSIETRLKRRSLLSDSDEFGNSVSRFCEVARPFKMRLCNNRPIESWLACWGSDAINHVTYVLRIERRHSQRDARFASRT